MTVLLCFLSCSCLAEADSLLFLIVRQMAYLTLHWDVSSRVFNPLCCLQACVLFFFFYGKHFFRLFCHWGNWLDSSAHWQTVAFVFTVLDHWARRGREKVYSLLSTVRLFSLCGILLATSCMEPFHKPGCLCLGKRHRLILHIAQLFSGQQSLLTVSLCRLMWRKQWIQIYIRSLMSVNLEYHQILMISIVY